MILFPALTFCCSIGMKHLFRLYATITTWVGMNIVFPMRGNALRTIVISFGNGNRHRTNCWICNVIVILLHIRTNALNGFLMLMIRNMDIFVCHCFLLLAILWLICINSLLIARTIEMHNQIVISALLIIN